MLNKAILIGNLGKDPEIRVVGETRKVANFSLATTEKWKNKEGEIQERTTWHNCVAWSPLAEIIEKYVHKGSQLYIEGKISNTSYEHEGVTKYKSEIEVKELKLLGKRTEGENSSSQSPTSSQPPRPEQNSGGDDLPF